MARFPERGLNQTAVLWSATGPDGYGGYLYGEPAEIDCLWVASTQVITDAKGQEVVSRAFVQVKQDLEENDFLFLGTLDDLDSGQEDDPATVDGAWRVRRFDKNPTLKKPLRYMRVAYL
jgi:hypothetical protein